MTLFWVISAVVLLFGFVVAFGAPYVPSLKSEVRNAFHDLYEVTSSDIVVDLGSGDGQVLLEAAKLGAKGYGYELNPLLVLISQWRLRKKAVITMANMWNVKLPRNTTLVYCFIVSRDARRLSTMLQAEANRLKRPLMVMSFGAQLKDHEPRRELKAHSLYKIEPSP